MFAEKIRLKAWRRVFLIIALSWSVEVFCLLNSKKPEASEVDWMAQKSLQNKQFGFLNLEILKMCERFSHIDSKMRKELWWSVKVDNFYIRMIMEYKYIYFLGKIYILYTIYFMTMKYTKFILENYKWIQWELEINLSSINTNLITFVWLNESGKTSILEWIDLLRSPISQWMAHTLIHKWRKASFSGKISITAHVELDEDDEQKIKKFCNEKFWFILSENIQAFSITHYYNFTNSQCTGSWDSYAIKLQGLKSKKSKKIIDLNSYNIDHWRKTVTYIRTSLMPRIIYYKDFLFDFPDKIYLDIDNENLSNTEKIYTKVFNDIVTSTPDHFTIHDHIIERLENPTSWNKEALQATLSAISNKWTTTVFSRWEKIFSRDTTSKEIILETNKDDNEDESRNKWWYITVKIKQNWEFFSVNERSLWFCWFFSFLIFTEFRKVRTHEWEELIFLLDEPANNLHQKSQQKLLEVFDELSEWCKIMYSTHSHHLISPKHLSWAFIVRNSAIDYENESSFDAKSTKIDIMRYKNFVSIYPNERDHFKPILDSLEYIPSNLETVRPIICTEWKNDYYTFNYFKEKLSPDLDIWFYPWASSSKLDEILWLYLSWWKSIFAILDDDSEWRRQKLRYIKDISWELTGRVITLRDIEEWFDGYTTESLFTDADRMRIIQALYPDVTTYNKWKFNAALEHVFLQKIEIDFSNETIENFKKILNYIRTHFITPHQ